MATQELKDSFLALLAISFTAMETAVVSKRAIFLRRDAPSRTHVGLLPSWLCPLGKHHESIRGGYARTARKCISLRVVRALCVAGQPNLYIYTKWQQLHILRFNFCPASILEYQYSLKTPRLQFFGFAAPGPVGMISPASSNTAAK